MRCTTLPQSVEINGKECTFDADFRNIIDIFIIMDDPNLLEQEKIVLSLDYFYDDDTYLQDIQFAIKYMCEFLSMGEIDESSSARPKAKLYDWEQDFNIIVAPINTILGFDVRSKDFLHWWTFLSAFMEIGKCTFNTYVGIRDKLNRHLKLEKWEQQIYSDNKNGIVLKRRYDDTTQELINSIMGKEV